MAISIRVDAEGDTAVVRVAGAVVVQNRKVLEQHVVGALARGLRHVTVDLAAVPSMDHGGLSTLMRVAERVRDAGGTLCVAHPNATMREVFAVTQLDTVLTVLGPDEHGRAGHRRTA